MENDERRGVAKLLDYFLRPSTCLIDRTNMAFGFARGAGVAAMQNKPVMCMFHIFFGNHFEQLLFDF